MAAARAWFNASLPVITASPLIEWWEGLNELDGQPGYNWSWYAAFEIERVALLQGIGKRAIIGSFITGNIDVNAHSASTADGFSAFLPAVRAAAAAGGALSIHEYSAPLLYTCYDNATGTGPQTGHYRAVYSKFLTDPVTGAALIPLFLSEIGVGWSSYACGGNETAGGWQAYCSNWTSVDPPGAYPGMPCPQAFVSQLAWYDSLLQADAYVMGAAVFCQQCGSFSSFDTAPALAELAAYMTANSTASAHGTQSAGQVCSGLV